jgi:hypothetical protein
MNRFRIGHDSFAEIWTDSLARDTFFVLVRRIRESGFEDLNLFANFAGEREDSNPKAKDLNLCCQVKRTQNLSKSSKFGQLLACLCVGNYQPKTYTILNMFLQIFIQNVILWPFLTVFALKVSDESFLDFLDSDSNPDSCVSFSISAKDSLGFKSQI